MTHEEFFTTLRAIGPLRVISIAGPSVFEALCTVDTFEIADGHLNAITAAYHWHLRLDRFRWLQAHDETHARSGRRVLYFELREAATSTPFLTIYAHRERGAEFSAHQEATFGAARAAVGAGVEVAS